MNKRRIDVTLSPTRWSEIKKAGIFPDVDCPSEYGLRLARGAILAKRIFSLQAI